MKKKEIWWTCGELNCKEPKINVKQINKPKMVNLLNNLNWGILKNQSKTLDLGISYKRFDHWSEITAEFVACSLADMKWSTLSLLFFLFSFFFFLFWCNNRCGWEIRIEPKFRQLNVNHKTLDIWVGVIVVHLKFDDTVGVIL